jgi:hypothetical protein
VHFFHDALGRVWAIHGRDKGARTLDVDLAQDIRSARITEENAGALVPEPRDQVGIGIECHMWQLLRVQD